jgi:hypothetical protein
MAIANPNPNPNPTPHPTPPLCRHKQGFVEPDPWMWNLANDVVHTVMHNEMADSAAKMILKDRYYRLNSFIHGGKLAITLTLTLTLTLSLSLTLTLTLNHEEKDYCTTASFTEVWHTHSLKYGTHTRTHILPSLFQQ